MKNNNGEIPQNATIRKEYVKCGNPDCQTIHRPHGPYLYAYWRQDKKLKKIYVGKKLEDFVNRKRAKQIEVKPSQYLKFGFIQQEASSGNELAKQYLEKLKKEEVSIGWAYRVLINRIREQRLFMMMTIAQDRHFIYDNQNDLIEFIASEMQKEGLDAKNKEHFDCYLNTKAI
jgi:hypothetical protein